MCIDWEKYLTVKQIEFEEQFTRQEENCDGKIQIRGFSIPFLGTQQKFNKLLAYLDKQLQKYVFPEREIEDHTWREARDKFGNNDPSRDGKLGEMLLYIFTEAVLGTPLMAYKLKDLGNPNDQVKGADGVFVGRYEEKRALLIGESKIHDDFGSAISSSLESIQRFHEGHSFYSNELQIAKKFPHERMLDSTALEEVLRLFDEDYEILVHPVFISYSMEEIKTISHRETQSADAEQSLKDYFISEIEELNKKIHSYKNSYPKPFQVSLDFFFLPVENSLNLRKDFYFLLHGCSYRKKK